MERASQILTTEDMKAASEVAAYRQASLGGVQVREVTVVSDPVLVRDGLWLVNVLVVMADGTERVFRCDATERDVFAIREVSNT